MREIGDTPTETCSSHPSSMVISPRMLVDVFFIEMDRIREWRTIMWECDEVTAKWDRDRFIALIVVYV